MNEQELNKKLAEWVECELNFKGNEFWVEDAVKHITGTPDFTQSLDACFKWLEPKLDYVRLEMLHEPYPKSLEGYTEKKAYRATIKYVNRIKDHCCEEPALALCLAIEKLIDSET